MSNELAEILTSLSGTFSGSLEKVVTRAHEARARLRDDMPDLGAGPQELHEFLQRSRAEVDVLEELLSQLILVRAKVEQYVQQRRGEVEDAEIEALGKLKPDDFASARGRDVELNMRTIDSRRALRKAETMYRDVMAAQEYVRTLHRGSDNLRRDTETRLRAVALVSGMERGG